MTGSLAVASTSNAADTHGEIDAQRWKPAPGADNLVMLETARTTHDVPLDLSLYFSYTHDPFRLNYCTTAGCPDGSSRRLNVLQDLETFDLMAAWTPIDRLQLGLRVPLRIVSGDGVVTDPNSTSYGQGQPGGLSGTTLGDPELEAKLRVLGTATSLFSAGLAGTISAPLSHAMDDTLYMGESTFTPGLRAMADVKSGRFFAAANVGVVFRSSAHIGTLDLGPEMRYGVGGGVSLTRDLRVLGEFLASTNFASDSGTDSAELDFALQYAIPKAPISLTAGGGPGLNEGFGSPTYRLFLGAAYAFGHKKSGAAEVDMDDRDGDGIPDRSDYCPAQGGNVVRIPGQYYGCPVRDVDNDTVPDHLDACPTVPGVATADPKTNGCPSNDRDNDGIPNDTDKCPDAPETRNGFEDEDGCPDTPPVISVQVQADRIVVLNERIEFEKNSDQLTDARARQALDLVAESMQQHPEIRQVEVSGHTDSTGTPEFNLALSKRRAESVIAYLIGRGVARDRLVANRHGQADPIAGNDTEDGRAQNRRVQFKILVMAK